MNPQHLHFKPFFTFFLFRIAQACSFEVTIMLCFKDLIRSPQNHGWLHYSCSLSISESKNHGCFLPKPFKLRERLMNIWGKSVAELDS